MFRPVCLLGAFVLVTASSPPARGKLPPIIPREVLFGNPVKASPRISPDGKRLAYLAPDKNNVLQVWVQTIGKEDAKQVTADKKRGIRTHQWTYAPETLIYLQDNEGDENFHIYAVNVTTSKVRDLTPFEGVRAQPQGMHRDYPNEMLVGLNRRDKRIFDVYRLKIDTGEATLDTKNPGGIVGWSTDTKFRIRIANQPRRDGGTILKYRPDDKAEWKTLLEWGPDDADGGVVSFSKDNKSVLMLTSQGRDTQALVRRDLASGKEKVIASDPRADAGGIILNPETYEVEAVSFNREKVRWKALDKTVAADLAALEKGAKGEPSIVSADRARKTWVVAYSADVTPTTFYLFDRPTRKLTRLFSAKPELAKYTLAPMKPVTIKSRDGLEMVAYLTLPVGIEAKKLPTVLLVHGGPWARDSWGYDAQVQWLANRGYAVLQVNFRGSTGFGKKFLHAGDREWGKKMHDDLIDAVDWAVKQGHADPKKVAIMGGSYGGYAALAGATFTPDTFACAISIVGPSNLVTLLKSIPPYWEPLKNLFSVRVGDIADEKFLESRSPLFKAHRIKIPMMIAQGANDPRVKQAESEQIVEALRKAGKPVEYLLFKDEGHGFVRPANRMTFFAAAEAFLAKHLGGRAEPAGKKQMKPILIVDYGMANLRSVQKALERVGAAAEISGDPDRVGEAARVVLPGVGAFRDAIARLREAKLVAPLLAHLKAGKPFFGICLGMQLLFARSHEDGLYEGLGVFGGEVVRFDNLPGLKVPHMGWNTLRVRQPAPALAGLDGQAVYFVHSYYPVPTDARIVAAETDYPTPFASAVWRENIFATQFHPEKSQAVGLRMLRQFAQRD